VGSSTGGEAAAVKQSSRSGRGMNSGDSSRAPRVGHDGGRRAGSPCFEDNRKPGKVEQGWEVQRRGGDGLPSAFSSSEQDAAGQEAALAEVQMATEGVRQTVIHL